MSVLVFYLTEASLATHKNRTKPVSTHFFPQIKVWKKRLYLDLQGKSHQVSVLLGCIMIAVTLA